MNLMDISNIRLINQQIVNSKFTNIKDVVGWMGAIQAQDYSMAKWAIGARLPNINESQIEEAIKKVDIIRTHILRPTWHFVSSDDIYWMLELAAPQIMAATKSRDNSLGINESAFQKSNAIFEKVLSGGKQLLREELATELKRLDIATGDNRLYHFLIRAEIDGIIFSRNTGNKQTFSLLHEIIPKAKSYTRDEALVKLAKKYFKSHGPATIHDFSWWSGLSIGESRKALEMSLPDFISEKIENQTFWFSPSVSSPKSEKDLMFLLPAFDEFLVSYKNRTASISLEYQHKAFTSNGTFRPTIVFNGQVVGIWSRAIKKDKVLLEIELSQRNNEIVKDMILTAATPFGNFSHKQAEVTYRA